MYTKEDGSSYFIAHKLNLKFNLHFDLFCLVYRHIDYAIRNYANISALTVGAFGYQLARDKQGGETTNSTKMNSPSSSKLKLSPRPDRMSTISVCYHRYANATLNPSLGEYFIDAAISERCLDLVADSADLPPPGSPAWANFSYLEYLNRRAPELVDDFEALLQCTVKLPLRTILLNTIVAFNTPQCFDLDVALNFDNRAHSGEIKVNMVAHNRQIDCRGRGDFGLPNKQSDSFFSNFSSNFPGNLEDHSRETHSHNVHISVNVVVLVLCSLSLVLCIRSLWRGQALRRRTVRFFALAYRRHLESASSLHFIDGWILMILLNDLLLLTGTAINLLRQLYLIGPHSHFSLRPIDFDNICSALLGVGNLLVWCGLLRYLAFFSRYNLLIVTLKHALSRVLRFLLCVLILYGGFCFSGWIILGPYHWKFRTLARTSECLFALMNGDDVFATFAYLQSGGSSTFVWWFSRLYLYSFVLLFIYVVLSLFIAILMDSYETIKEFYRSRSEKARKGNGGAKSSLMFSNDQLARFIAADQGDDGQGMMGSGESGGGDGVTSNENHHLDWTTSYRISLLHDEEMEFQKSQQSSTAARRRMMEASADQIDGGGGGSGNNGDANGGCHCCICHFLQAFLAPLSCFRTAFTSLRSKLGARTAAGGGGRRRRLDEVNDDDDDDDNEEGNDDDSSTNADESATLRIN